MEESVAYCGLPFLGTYYPVLDVGYNYLVWND